MRLGLPVHYVVAYGAGVQECAAINAATTVWKVADFVSSYSELGNNSYKAFEKILSENRDFTFAEICQIVTGLDKSAVSEALRNGSFMMTEAMAEQAKTDLAYVRTFFEDLKRVSGPRTHYTLAILFAVKSGADKTRMKKVLSTSILPPAPTRKIALENLTEAYNKGLTNGNRMYFYPMYEESLVKKYGWYGARLEKNGGKGWGK